jgi:hypothetical protein
MMTSQQMGSFRGKGKETGLVYRSFNDNQALIHTHSSYYYYYYYYYYDKVVITKDARGVDVKIVQERQKNHWQLVKAIISMGNDNNNAVVPDDGTVSASPDPLDKVKPNIFYLGSDSVHVIPDETDKNGSWRHRRRRRNTGQTAPRK